MVRISKDPKIRRQELIDAAKVLFFTKGYAKTSMKDILAAVNGQPGMFYHYFQSKDEIYHVAVNQFMDEYVANSTRILENKEQSISSRMEALLLLIKESIGKFDIATNTNDQVITTETSALTIVKILNSLSEPFSNFLMEIQEKGLITNYQVTQDNARKLAVFLLYGIYGVIHDRMGMEIKMELLDENVSYVMPFFTAFLGINPDRLLE